jgi:hypothetical protein
MRIDGFKEVVTIDFEFGAHPGERPDPVCLVAHELVSGRVHHLWQDKLRSLNEPPYPIGSDCLMVAYYASAEIGCHLVLGWPVPRHVLDLYSEFRLRTNGLALACGAGLLGALVHFGLDAIGAANKESMRALALRGGPWSAEERHALLQYCASDVVALDRLLPRMLPKMDLPRALLRGRYMTAAARMEHVGIPIDLPALKLLRRAWPVLQDDLIRRVDETYGVFDGHTFKADRWAGWLREKGIPWPQLPSGRLALDDATFREMARVYPSVAPMHDLRVSLSQMRLEELAVGADGRNRCLLSAFRAKTSRNQPSNTKFIFGPAVWLRALIKPAPGWAIAYIDWEQQEFGIAAALSGDREMITAYDSGDPYLAFAKQASAVPIDATKQTHTGIREQFKACALAVQYGMGAKSLAQRIGQPEVQAQELLRLHQETYRQFWRWSDAVVDYAMVHNRLFTTFGWTIHVGTDVNARSLRNFPMQANGAEMLRLACCFATEGGVRVCAPVHDALLIEAPVDQLDTTVRMAQQAMAQASRLVLDGFELRSAATLTRYPERYRDARGAGMWAMVWDTARAMVTEPAHERTPDGCTGATTEVHSCTPVPSYLLSPCLSLQK